MTKKIVKYLGILLAMAALVGVLVFGIQAAMLYRDTLSAKGLIAYCAEKSLRGAAEFVPVEDDSNSGLCFYVATGGDNATANGDMEKGQELYVFQQEAIFGRKVKRYTPVTDSLNSTDLEPGSPVGVCYMFGFAETAEGERLQSIVFFSENTAQITSYVTEIYIDNSTSPVTGILMSDAPFVFVVPGVSKADDAEIVMNSAKFIGGDGEVVWEYVNPKRRLVVPGGTVTLPES